MIFLYHPSVRSLMYLNELMKLKVKVDLIVVLGNDNHSQIKNLMPDGFWNSYSSYFDIHKNLDFYLDFFSCETVYLPSSNINSDELYDLLSERKQETCIFSGGGIVHERFFSLGKKFIHTHPGELPRFRGSTCFYYSMIEIGHVSATTFYLDVQLDTGPSIHSCSFSVPKIPEQDWKFFDLIFDPWIRSQTLGESLKKMQSNDLVPILPDGEGVLYYIIHPVLKNLAMRKFYEKN